MTQKLQDPNELARRRKLRWRLGRDNQVTTRYEELGLDRVPTTWDELKAAAEAEGLEIAGRMDGLVSIARRSSGMTPPSMTAISTTAKSTVAEPATPAPSTKADTTTQAKATETAAQIRSRLLSDLAIQAKADELYRRGTLAAARAAAESAAKPMPEREPELNAHELAAEATRIRSLLKRQMAINISFIRGVELAQAKSGATLPDSRIVDQLAQLHICEQVERGRRPTYDEALQVVSNSFRH